MPSPASSSLVDTQPAATKPGDTTNSEPVYPAHLLRPGMEQWVEISEGSPFDPVPPVCMVMFPDLLGRVWGWQRLLPDVHGSVEWHYYKSYLLQYLEKNGSKNPSGKEALLETVNSCIEAERRLVRTCHSVLSYEELCLTNGIKNQARQLLESDGEYPAAAATLLALMREAELMCEMKIKGYAPSAVRTLAHQIREAAFKLILCGGSESAAVTAAMMGLEEASKALIDELREDGSCAFTIFYQNASLRRGIAKVLTKLGEEVARETTGNAGTLTTATKDLKGDDEKGDKKMSKSSHSVLEGLHDETGTNAYASSDNGHE